MIRSACADDSPSIAHGAKCISCTASRVPLATSSLDTRRRGPSTSSCRLPTAPRSRRCNRRPRSVALASEVAIAAPIALRGAIRSVYRGHINKPSWLRVAAVLLLSRVRPDVLPRVASALGFFSFPPAGRVSAMFGKPGARRKVGFMREVPIFAPGALAFQNPVPKRAGMHRALAERAVSGSDGRFERAWPPATPRICGEAHGPMQAVPHVLLWSSVGRHIG